MYIYTRYTYVQQNYLMLVYWTYWHWAGTQYRSEAKDLKRKKAKKTKKFWKIDDFHFALFRFEAKITQVKRSEKFEAKISEKKRKKRSEIL